LAVIATSAPVNEARTRLLARAGPDDITLFPSPVRAIARRCLQSRVNQSPDRFGSGWQIRLMPPPLIDFANLSPGNDELEALVQRLGHEVIVAACVMCVKLCLPTPLNMCKLSVMSNPFERHGIRHLSPSSLALYRAAPALWVLRYLYCVRDESNCYAARGKAVETAVDAILMEGASDNDAISLALTAFDDKIGSDMSSEVSRERGATRDFVRQASPVFRELGRPLFCQRLVEVLIDEIEAPIIGYADYVYPSFTLDLKTTFAIPSVPRADHAVQIAFYATALRSRPGLIYVSPRRVACYGPDSIDVDGAWRLLQQSARAVRAMLAASETREAAAAMFVPVDDFRWSSTTRSAAQRIWA
jgi:hypothetical protein